ncbi:group I truncated hemoglobin [Sphingomonas japonica]|uniref:Hemoglobin n=1 Tax=Sphingomonas japonica TaxID=511662 RepID=A0ABX0U332_9SPHN|nr:group 1 truncated hemoglobin [Sphingomonas japonica]NIJ23767.1 hemoglobin [Sphingomonas japonica]
MPAILLAVALLFQETPPAAPPHAMPGEEAVEPYAVRPGNLGARAFEGDAMAQAFHGQDGIHRIVDGFVRRNFADPVTGPVFANHDQVRLKRTIFEQFCAILNAGCSYSGRDMKAAHKDLGIQQADMNRLVENLQAAMADEGVSFSAQNRFLSKLAPMRGQVVER